MKIILLATLILITFKGKAQDYEWALNLGAAGDYAAGYSTAIDTNGNVYVIGAFEGMVDFDPSANTANLAAAGNNDDVFLAKYDNNGNYLWAIKIGANADDLARNIVIDGNGDLYIIGSFGSNVDFDPSANSANLVSAGSNDIFLAKYDANGNYIWAKKMGGTGYDLGLSLAVDTSNNAYISGSYVGTVDFDPSANTTNLVSEGGRDIFLAKYDVNGNYVWAKNIGGTNDEETNNIAIGESGNIYITGSYVGMVDFDPSGDTVALTSNGSSDIFLAKYNANGGYIWAKSIGGASLDKGLSMVINDNEDIHLTGYFTGSADFDPSANTVNLAGSAGIDIFLAKYDSNGNYIWAKDLGGNDYDLGSSVALDNNGAIYITGTFRGLVDFDPSANTANVGSSGSGRDIFLAKYDSNGDYIWAKDFGASPNDEGRNIALDADGNLFLTGEFRGTVDFDPSANTNNLTATGIRDAFLAKYSQSCIINIPDANFKAYLVGNTAINTNGDTSIQCSEASAFTGTINCNSYNTIADLTGIEAFINLTELRFLSNQVASIDLSQNVMLEILDCSSNLLTSLDLSHNSNLEIFGCQLNSLTTIDVSQNLNLTYLACDFNQLTSLDVSLNTSLTSLICMQNSLTSLNVANGNNTNFTTFDARLNPNLTCIQVDDAAYSTTNWTNVDATTSFNTNCSTIVGLNKIETTSKLSSYPNPTTGLVTFESAEPINSIEIYDLAGKRLLSFFNRNSIDISQLNKGIYISKVLIENKIAVQKIIKE